MLRSGLVAAALALTAAAGGCRMCASPYDYCGPFFGDGCHDCFHDSPRRGSILGAGGGYCPDGDCATCGHGSAGYDDGTVVSAGPVDQHYGEGEYVEGGYTEGPTVDEGSFEGGYVDGGYADGGYVDGGYIDGGYVEEGPVSRESDGSASDPSIPRGLGAPEQAAPPPRPVPDPRTGRRPPQLRR